MRRDIGLAGALTLAAILGTLLWLAAPARATSTLIVTTTGDTIADDGVCSLREAIIAANTDSATGGCLAGSGADTIEFEAALPQPITITLTMAGADEQAALTGDLDLSGTVTINGPAAIDGNQLDRVFEIAPGARVTLIDLIVQHGAADFGGGLVISTTGALTLTNSAVIGNSAQTGGGIWLKGKLVATDSAVSSNAGGGIFNAGGNLILNNAHIVSNTLGYGLYNAQGALSFNGGTLRGNRGGLYNAAFSTELFDVSVIGNTEGSGVYNASAGAAPASVTIARSEILSNTGSSGGGVFNAGANATVNLDATTIAYNTAQVNGGGVYNQAVLTLRNSTLHHNTAHAGGGLHHNGGGSVTLINDTFSANHALDNGGGVYNKAGVILANVTLAHNAADGAGGAIFNNEASSFPRNTLFFGNTSSEGSCVSSPLAAQVSQGYNLDDDNTCSLTAAGDITHTNALIGPLQDNGGHTWTHALLAASPAIERGTNAGCPAADQRGVTRPYGVNCDIGAYEFDGVAADLSITKQATSAMVDLGSTLTYRLTVTNRGPLAAENVTVTDQLTSVLAFQAAAGEGWQCDENSGQVSCTRTAVAFEPGTIMITVTAPATATVIHNTATITSSIADPTPGNNTSTAVTRVLKLLYLYLPLIERGQ
ncbi:MAG: DUF11 domain-containing protein [Chloroflexi bacterium]|nr:DUF11 domain-containing protein [Chloroflexota bacterium]